MRSFQVKGLMCVIKSPYLAINPWMLRKVLPLIGNLLDSYINLIGNCGVKWIIIEAAIGGANSLV
jgi:hypothetical protein